jgi:site-specific DNA-methyltransferase (adenine-specific)
MRQYAKDVLKKFINHPYSKIKNALGNQGADHFLNRTTTSQFGLPTQETYNNLIDLYKINEMSNFKTFEELTKEKIIMTYNPQKTPGKPWKIKGHKIKTDVYGQTGIVDLENTTGDRHPKSVLKFHQNGDKLHPTQKPLELCEWLIKTYSNEGDLVLDFCMGSGTTIEACINTNRNYIGIEKDEKIFEVAKKRVFEDSRIA